MNKLISVIINVYNCEDYIGRCLDSVINQTYKNIEILIVNDGSTDNTLNIIKKYKDKRIRIINQDNMGLSKSRNVALDNAKGDYLYFVDADDYIELDAIEYLYNMIKKDKTKIATCNSIDIFDNKNIINKSVDNKSIISSVDLLKKVLLNDGRHGCTWNKLTHKSVYKDIRFEDRIVNDVAVTYKMLLSVDKISYSTCAKYYYYRYPNSTIGKKSAARGIDLYNACVERYDYINKIYPNMIENNIGLLIITMVVYNYDRKEIYDYFKKVEAKKRYNKLFSFGVIKYKMNIKNKVKLILFRISPKLLLFMIKVYMKIKK